MTTLDGAHGEGGGQILRSAVALSALTGRAVRIENVRAGRPRPGLAAQHLTSVRGAAATCGAHLDGDEIGSSCLVFEPRAAPRAGEYRFDVAAARAGGSAGSASLVLQTVLLPLTRAAGASRVVVRGGTHVPASPPFEFLEGVWRHALARIGFDLTLELVASGWFPVGEGEVHAALRGSSLSPLHLEERGALVRVSGRALAANLPAHICQRMARRAESVLAAEGIPCDIRPERLRAASPGAGLFLVAEYEDARAGASALGRRGKPAESVTDEAVEDLLRFHRSAASVDRHLADQLVLPLALAAGPSAFTVERVTRHLVTNAWVVEQLEVARIAIEGAEGEPGRVVVEPLS